jgi:hypothetical protein
MYYIDVPFFFSLFTPSHHTKHIQSRQCKSFGLNIKSTLECIIHGLLMKLGRKVVPFLLSSPPPNNDNIHPLTCNYRDNFGCWMGMGMLGFENKKEIHFEC